MPENIHHTDYHAALHAAVEAEHYSLVEVLAREASQARGAEPIAIRQEKMPKLTVAELTACKRLLDWSIDNLRLTVREATSGNLPDPFGVITGNVLYWRHAESYLRWLRVFINPSRRQSKMKGLANGIQRDASTEGECGSESNSGGEKGIDP